MEEPFVFKVNLGGMIDILANHLYSSPDVFVRELLQNGTDAISGRKKADPAFSEGRIDITVQPETSLTFTDNGVGLTEAEIHQFLAVIGQSSKRDLQTGRILEDYIGRFGIGMLSCFMVTDEIVLWTRSAKQPENAYCFCGKPDGTYSIRIAEEEVPVGTKICIQAKKGCEHYFTEDTIVRLVRHYGLPLPFPVMMHGEEETFRINEPLRMTGANAREQMLSLGRNIFEEEFLDCIPLESKSGLFSGVAYIMSHAVSVHAKTQHRIYLKNMLLTEDGSVILPKWSFFLRCFLNTETLRPTASRENFYEDEVLWQAQKELNECIAAYLIRLSRTDPQRLQRIIDIHFLAIKSMAAEDDLFFKTFLPFLEFETNMGKMTGKELLAKGEAVGYTTDMNQFHRTSSVMLAQGQLLVNACYVYDAELLRKMADTYEGMIQFYPLRLISFEEFLEEPHTDAQVTAAAFLKAAKRRFQKFGCEVELKSFSPATLPVFYTLDENAQIRREIEHSKEHSHEMFAAMLNAFAEELPPCSAMLYLNWNNPLIQKLAALEDAEKQMVCLEILYVQALLTGRFPMRGDEMNLLNTQLMQLIEWGIG